MKDLSRFLNLYRCPRSGIEWESLWDCTCDDRCPYCDTPHSPYASEDTQETQPEVKSMIADLGTAPEYVYDQMHSQPHEVYDTRSIVVMSTAHMTLSDAEKLWEDIDRVPCPTYNMGAGYGYMIRVNPYDDDIFEENLIQMAEEGYSGILACALLRAHNRGFDYLWLDPDGLVVISLPKSDW